MSVLVKKELAEVRDTYADDRKTKVYVSAAGQFSDEDLIPREETIVSLTKDGYIKRVSPSLYKAQNRGGKGIIGMETREEDVISRFLIASTHDRLLFFYKHRARVPNCCLRTPFVNSHRARQSTCKLFKPTKKTKK